MTDRAAGVGARTWRIRDATPKDARAIAELNAIVQAVHHAHHPEVFKAPDVEGFLPVVREWLESDGTKAFIAEDDDGIPCAYVLAVLRDRPDNALLHRATYVELDQIAVAEPARRQCIGRALTECVLRWATDRDVDRVQLATWDFNEAANRLFVGLGFATTTQHLAKSVTSR